MLGLAPHPPKLFTELSTVVFSETRLFSELPRRVLLGNWVSGVGSSRKLLSTAVVRQFTESQERGGRMSMPPSKEITRRSFLKLGFASISASALVFLAGCGGGGAGGGNERRKKKKKKKKK